MESISSPSALMEWMFCSSKYTSTPISFSSRTVSKRVTVFLAKREIDLVMTMSTLPALQSFSRRVKFFRSAFVPVSASSAYTPQNTQPG